MDKNQFNDEEKLILARFAKDEKMVAAVKKLFLATIYSQGTLEAGKTPNEFNFIFNIVSEESKSDEQIGQETRASVAALGFLKHAFTKLKEFLPAQPTTPKAGNPAR